MAFSEQTLATLKKAGLSAENIKALSSLKYTPLAPTTLISHLGFEKESMAKLPADVQHLTKADLLSLGGWGTTKLTPAAEKLKATDVASIKTVLGSELAAHLGKVADDINCCCCCCPCCCAAAVTVGKVPRTAAA